MTPDPHAHDPVSGTRGERPKLARRLLALASMALLVITVTSCSFREAAPEPVDESQGSELPPNDGKELAAMFDAELEPFGLRLARGALVDLGGNGYEFSDTGTHLALYVEPVSSPYSRVRYLRNLAPVAKVFAPEVFERWPGLESFDVCQEPPASIDDSDEPPPETQVNMSREQSEGLEWDSLDNVDLLAAALSQPPGVRLIISERIRDLSEYDRLLAEVKAETGLEPPNTD